MENKIKIVVSGGGTAGHVYPAVAVVEALEAKLGKENVEALFVGADGKMEMTLVPKLGYKIEGVPVRGIQRKFTLQNIKTLFDFVRSVSKCHKILKDFKPDILFGFGGYASAPIMFAARKSEAKKYLWEGNSFGGAANRMLAKYADKIFVSYDKMERFFPKEKLVKSGNPIRSTFKKCERKESEALAHFGIENNKKVISVTGGSLGARILNEGVMFMIDKIIENSNIHLIWQTGSYYFEEMKERCKDKDLKNVWMAPFIDNMSGAYSAADLIICRSGASTVTELALCALPALFIPSSGVTDDHQTKNAAAVVEGGAAAMLKDDVAVEEMMKKALEIVSDDALLAQMAKNMEKFAAPDAAKEIVNNILGE